MSDNRIPDSWVFYRNTKRKVDLDDPNEFRMSMYFDWYIGPKILIDPIQNIALLTNCDQKTQRMFKMLSKSFMEL